MTPKNLIALFLLGLTCNSHALTEQGKKAGEELLSILREDAKIQEGQEKKDQERYPLRMVISQLDTVLSQQNNYQIEQSLDNYAQYFRSEKSIQALVVLKESLRKEREQKIKQTLEKLESLLTRAKETVVQAKSPQELDGLIVELTQAEPNYNSDMNLRDPNISQLTQQVGYAKRFVIAWQNYLQATQSDDGGSANQALQNLSSMENGSLIPRSQILALLSKTKPRWSEDGTPPIDNKQRTNEVLKILSETKSLDQMRDSLNRLNDLSTANRNSNNDRVLKDSIQILSRMEKTYREYLAGLPVAMELFGQNYGESPELAGQGNLVQLKADLLKTVLPRFIGAPEGTRAKADENVMDFLDRLSKEAESREDISGIQQIYEAKRSLFRSASYSTSDINALRDYSAALQQTKAGQYTLAVMSFQRSLATGSEIIPAKLIGEKLQILQNEHPQDYQQGMTAFLTPMIPSDPARMSGSDAEQRMREQQRQRPVILPVPGRNNPRADAQEDSKAPEARDGAKPDSTPATPPTKE